ncbi:pyridoxamine 5'-phosphate oxidase family protein [Streptomyces triticagri]|uniref:pyridoxamine 5'-phosphate oxidase family protein n=1 Tax=Streptomyces triticagri TaxID=2293568 RepID=UPI001F311BC6|nr:pyridoxamine 5'-phosphate oxidase family protein [Streptomyces triticagri]
MQADTQNTPPTTEDARRPAAERRRQTLDRLATERDIWLATSHPEHGPHQAPFWFSWDGRAVWVCTGAASATVRNVREERRVHLSLPDTADVVMLQGEADCYADQDVPEEAADRFTAKFGWDPRREEGSFVYIRITPAVIRAWRDEPELRGRVIMRDGTWL